ncbi:MAG: alpha/beta hydrolase [Pseudomonadaceae bacterium]|nr:alpha/beta hydrolase [Pseudomonadaceae bacterium]
MNNRILTKIRPAIQKSIGWSKGLAPYVARTLSLQRPLANRKIQRTTTCTGIDEYFSIDINGHHQWLRIRGENPENPIILYLHGGPGGSQVPSYRYFQLNWELSHTVVHWEQRGAGKSYTNRLKTETLTVSQLVEDALSVIDYLSKRFGRQDIVLLGHSWGTFLGIHVLQTKPSAVSSYIGVGQIANQVHSERRMYEFALERAMSTGDEANASMLKKLQGYPLKNNSHRKVAFVRQMASFYGFLGSNTADIARTYNRLMETPEYKLMDIYRFLKGTLVSSATLGRAMFTSVEIQPTELPLEFETPIFLLSGRRDHFTPADLTDEYLKTIEAPAKKHVVFENCGHYPNEDEPERFIQTVAELTTPYLRGNE